MYLTVLQAKPSYILYSMLISVWGKTIIHVIFNANISVGSCYLAIVHRLVLYLLDQTFTRKNSDNAISIIHINEKRESSKYC